MNFETVKPLKDESIMKFSGLIFLPGVSTTANKIFSDRWGSMIIRPDQIVKEDSDFFGVENNQKAKGEMDECISMILDSFKKMENEFSELIFIDTSFRENDSNAVQLSFHVEDRNIFSLVLKNFEFSTVKYQENSSLNSRLVHFLKRKAPQIKALALNIPFGMFSTANNEEGLKIFEEVVIYSHLSNTQMLKG